MTAFADAFSGIKSLFAAPDPHERARKQLEKQLRREAMYFSQVIRARLTQLGICHRYKKSEKKQGVQEIQWLRSVGTPEAIYLMLDNRRLPYGIKISDLNDEEILDDLAVACRRPIRFRYQTKCGAWFVIERESGAWGVPRKIDFGEVLDNWPETSRKKLLVPLGVGENSKFHYRSLAEMPHCLVGGATGSGKSTMLHAMICALILKNSPEDLQVGFVDLKGGVEFTRYQELPHVITFGDEEEGDEVNGFVKHQDGVVPLLERIQEEMDRRLRKFEAAGGIQNLSVWNYRHRKGSLPRIVVFVDEMAVIMLDSDLKKRVEPLLADLTARGRGPGIHIVLSTQRPEVKVVSGLIKSNLEARLAFRVTDNASSMVLLDTIDAAKFDASAPPGRYLYKRGLEQYEIQAPWITAGQIREFVRNVREGRSDADEAAQMAPEDIFKLSVDQLDGSFSLRTLYDILGPRGVSQHYLEELAASYEGEVIQIESELYELAPARGNIPRRLVPVDEENGEGVPENGRDTRRDTSL
jgi:energy-coupling factor transporter ATP-binding protein EcfA2